MSTEAGSLKWSGQFSASRSHHSSKLQGDKITLPPSALEALLQAAPLVSISNGRAGPLTSAFDPYNPYTYAAESYAREQLTDRQQQLPQPLTFRLVNPSNGRVVYAGIREFSAAEDEVELSAFLAETLDISVGNIDAVVRNGDVKMVDAGGDKVQRVTVHAEQLPKGTYVRLRPLEAGYDSEDWKSLLERYLRDNFTTMTNGEILSIPGGPHEKFRFLVDKFQPEGNGICIIDTDLEVDIEALNEEQARETLHRKLAKGQRAPGTSQGSSAGGKLLMNQEVHDQVLPGEYIDYEIKDWARGKALEISLDSKDNSAILGLFVSPLSSRQRSIPRDDEHVFGDFEARASKRIRLSRTNVELEEAESIYVSVHAYRNAEIQPSMPLRPAQYVLHATSNSSSDPDSALVNHNSPASDEVICKNCHQHIPQPTLPLHEAFCYRNNIYCPHCSTVFLKSSSNWKNHWHCPHDSSFGNSPASHAHHDTIFHPSELLACPGCSRSLPSLPALANHRTSTCPAKLVLCRFCHLTVPQQSPSDPEPTDPAVLLSNLTPHEYSDGNRTTECHICARIVRLRDMQTHMHFHDRDRLARPAPHLCRNVLCGRTIADKEFFHVTKEQLGLCAECFAPLYSATYDPENKALKRRVERRLLSQLMAGCGQSWCANREACRTGRRYATGSDEVFTAKDALPKVRPGVDALVNGSGMEVRLCVDKENQRRRAIADMLADEGVYELTWCIKGMEEGHGNLDKAREWLSDQAPRIGEKL